jgi:hypothetical protein
VRTDAVSEAQLVEQRLGEPLAVEPIEALEPGQQVAEQRLDGVVAVGHHGHLLVQPMR